MRGSIGKMQNVHKTVSCHRKGGDRVKNVKLTSESSKNLTSSGSSPINGAVRFPKDASPPPPPPPDYRVERLLTETGDENPVTVYVLSEYT